MILYYSCYPSKFYCFCTRPYICTARDCLKSNQEQSDTPFVTQTWSLSFLRLRVCNDRYKVITEHQIKIWHSIHPFEKCSIWPSSSSSIAYLKPTGTYREIYSRMKKITLRKFFINNYHVTQNLRMNSFLICFQIQETVMPFKLYLVLMDKLTHIDALVTYNKNHRTARPSQHIRVK